ncbi:MAG: sulfotransferase family 2 domain-containing protein [Sulfitobacter sp.]|nr:sulfotransferase family 2 domain-containing protein [Sulfitobacter sp.]
MRTAILHYHLFKNAGTSVDQLLRHNFPDGWDSREFPGQGGNNTALVREWILDRPDISAFSSHTMLGPLPEAPGLRVIPVVLLRDPIARITSAYQFERTQRADTRGAKLAKAHDLEGYVSARLAMPGDRQCRNFQTGRLATLLPDTIPELERARAAVKQLRQCGIVGLVEAFDRAMAELRLLALQAFPAFEITPVRANMSGPQRTEVSKRLRERLEHSNAHDIRLLRDVEALMAAA